MSRSAACIRYPIGTSGQALVFDTSVLACLSRHRQLRWWHKEAGGQLFALIEDGTIRIVEATGPRRGDQRTRHAYVPDRHAEQVEIDERHRRGLHFVGDWHTHPELVPRPSALDLTSINEGFSRSTHALNGFVLAIVGTASIPKGLYVSVSDRVRTYMLHPESVQLGHRWRGIRYL